MEDGMHIGDLLQDVEDASNGIAESARKQKPEAWCGKQRPELRYKPYNRPAQAQVQHRRDPAGTEHPERFGNYANNGNGPNKGKQGNAMAINQSDQALGAIGSR